ncbi:hypothetical protein QBC40DRAFT_271120 [Triangularia verruculosa]|uniref:Uncharacterized protein n=1 Tax=Triangularia verruculosa TaxID=2587418 RepID=A0AAN6XVX7_9PEZI|nr:hypothetical protein QBC40DRAFT_271120 [Triangularia verruculosa]
MAPISYILTAGQIAGIAVGTVAFVGVIVVIVASFFFLLRKLRSARQQKQELEESGPQQNQEEPEPQNEQELEEPEEPKPWQLTPDYHHWLMCGRWDDFESRWLKMGMWTDRLTWKYCHKRDIPQDANQLEESLAIFELDEHTRSRIARLCLDPKTRWVALRSLLARVLTAGMDVFNITSLSLLPPHLVAFLRSLPPFGEKGQSRLGGMLFVIDMWRRCSARIFYHAERPHAQPLPPLTMIAPQMEALIAAFQQYLQYFYEEPDKNMAEIERILRGLVEDAAVSAYYVFSECSAFRFVYEPPSGDEKEIVITPGVEVLTYLNGDSVAKPFQKFEAEVVSMAHL